MSTSGCSCRYRSSLGSCSGGPGGTSGTGQYRCPVSGQRNSFRETGAIRRRRGYRAPSAPMDRPTRMTNPCTTVRIRKSCGLGRAGLRLPGQTRTGPQDFRIVTYYPRMRSRRHAAPEPPYAPHIPPDCRLPAAGCRLPAAGCRPNADQIVPAQIGTQANPPSCRIEDADCTDIYAPPVMLVHGLAEHSG